MSAGAPDLGAPGSGRPCVVCGKPLTRDEMAVELQFNTPGIPHQNPEPSGDSVSASLSILNNPSCGPGMDAPEGVRASTRERERPTASPISRMGTWYDVTSERCSQASWQFPSSEGGGYG